MRCGDLQPPGILKAGNTERNSTLTAWFKANEKAAQGSIIHKTLYQDFPSIMVWDPNSTWTLRKQGFTIGRMYYADPTSEERFYICLLLTIIKGAKGFDDLRTFEGTLYPTFKTCRQAINFIIYL